MHFYYRRLHSTASDYFISSFENAQTIGLCKNCDILERISMDEHKICEFSGVQTPGINVKQIVVGRCNSD